MLEFLSNIDLYLLELIAALSVFAYLLFFAVVFCESGVIPLILLPGDGFIFSLGVVARAGAMEILLLWPLLMIATILGYQFNYYLGAKYGLTFLQNRRWVKKEHIEKTQNRYKQHGQKAVLICRFIPIARTISPFLAGMANMPKKAFLNNNILGGSIWITILCLGGFFLGGIAFVRENFVWLFITIIIVTTTATGIGLIITKKRHLKQSN